MRALIVDDSRFIRQYLRQLLEGMGLSCEEAVDGDQALEMLRGTSLFDFMLLDVNMPKMSGLECVKATARGGPAAADEGDDGDHRSGQLVHLPGAGLRRRRVPDEAVHAGEPAREVGDDWSGCVRRSGNCKTQGKGQ